MVSQIKWNMVGVSPVANRKHRILITDGEYIWSGVAAVGPNGQIDYMTDGHFGIDDVVAWADSQEIEKPVKERRGRPQ